MLPGASESSVRTAMYSAYAPFREMSGREKTWSPALKRVRLGAPALATVPATSQPGISSKWYGKKLRK